MGDKKFQRRGVLKYIGLVSSVGLAGCSTTDNPNESTKSTVFTSSTTPNGLPTTSDTESSISTASEETTDDSGAESPTESTEFQIDPLEHDGTIAAFYYPWYKGKNGVPGFTSDGWLNITPGEPVLGEYHSHDLSIVNQHIKWSVENGINAWIIGGLYNKSNFRFLDSDFAHLIDYACLLGIPPKKQGSGIIMLMTLEIGFTKFLVI